MKVYIYKRSWKKYKSGEKVRSNKDYKLLFDLRDNPSTFKGLDEGYLCCSYCDLGVKFSNNTGMLKKCIVNNLDGNKKHSDRKYRKFYKKRNNKKRRAKEREELHNLYKETL